MNLEASLIKMAPPAFICTSSKQLMKDPVLSLCSHLFERSVVQQTPTCPIDSQRINITYCIPCQELKSAIQSWKSAQLARFKEVKQSTGASSSSMRAVAAPQVTSNPSGTLKRLFVVNNAHRDDIHGFVSISSTTFVSGSKDTSLKMWNHQGKLVREMDTNLTDKDYRYWVTSLTKFNNGNWASGTRDGYLTVWDPKGNAISTLQYAPSSNAKNQYIAKERNKSRINCITELPNNQSKLRFYTGTPRFVQLWNGDTSKMIHYYRAHENDWIYCVEVLENKNLLVVIGSDLEFWNMAGTEPAKSGMIQENPNDRMGKQRPHISAIKRLSHDTNLLANALFDGSVRIVDIQAQNEIKKFKEHKGRVWSVVNLRPQIFASSADDKTIKIWDLRQTKSIHTIGGNPGRVSSLLPISEHILISGSCPDDVRKAKDKASITFWDTRSI